MRSRRGTQLTSVRRSSGHRPSTSSRTSTAIGALAITLSGFAPDAFAGIYTADSVTLTNPAAFRAFTKLVTINSGGFTLQRTDVASGGASGTSPTFGCGTAITSATIRRGRTGTVLSSGSLTNGGAISGGDGAAGFV